jgi:hypothetical protein
LLYAFDLLELDGRDLRREAGALPMSLQLNEHIEEPGDIVFRHACKFGFEDISKRLSCPVLMLRGVSSRTVGRKFPIKSRACDTCAAVRVPLDGRPCFTVRAANGRPPYKDAEPFIRKAVELSPLVYAFTACRAHAPAASPYAARRAFRSEGSPSRSCRHSRAAACHCRPLPAAVRDTTSRPSTRAWPAAAFARLHDVRSSSFSPPGAYRDGRPCVFRAGRVSAATCASASRIARSTSRSVIVRPRARACRTRPQ